MFLLDKDSVAYEERVKESLWNGFGLGVRGEVEVVGLKCGERWGRLEGYLGFRG